MTQTADTPHAAWSSALKAALADANIPTLLMVLVHLTGDRKWLTAKYHPFQGLSTLMF